MNYGQIRDLSVRDREPIFTNSRPLVLADLKLDAEDDPRREATLSDFVLCAELERLMQFLDRIENGKIATIEIRGGLPRRITFEHSGAEFAIKHSH